MTLKLESYKAYRFNPSEFGELKAKVAEWEEWERHLLQEVSSRDEALSFLDKSKAKVEEVATRAYPDLNQD